MTDQEPELTAKGVTSQVGKSGDSDETMGHVLLIDWDDWDWTDNERIRTYVNTLPGVSLLIKSSSGSSHVWNLSIRDLDTTALELLKVKSDPMRTMLGYRWRPPRWVLRFSAKEHDDGTVAAPAPELQGIQINPTSIKQSAGHWAIASSFIDKMPKHGIDEIPQDLNWHRGRTQVDEYRALSEEQKNG